MIIPYNGKKEWRVKDPNRVESVDRALVLLQVLGTRGRLSVSDAAAEIGVAASTAHRLLATLVRRRFAVQGPGRLYYPGPELNWRTNSPTGSQLIRLMRPLIDQVHAATRETVHIMVPVGADVRLLDGLESEEQLRVGLRIGARMPAYCAAGGKAMFADLDWSEVEALHPNGLRPWPTAKIQDMEALRRHVLLARKRGYSTNADETERGVTVIGVSIRAPNGRPLAAMTVATPTARYDSRCETAFAEALAVVRVVAEREVEQHQ